MSSSDKLEDAERNVDKVDADTDKKKSGRGERKRTHRG